MIRSIAFGRSEFSDCGKLAQDIRAFNRFGHTVLDKPSFISWPIKIIRQIGSMNKSL